MRILCFDLLLFAYLLSMCSPVATDNKGETLIIEVCKIELTEIGRMSSFRFHLIYSLSTDKDGSIFLLKAIKNNKNAKALIKIDELESCLKNWLLIADRQYTVDISVGTTGGPNYIYIKDQYTTNIKLILK